METPRVNSEPWWDDYFTRYWEARGGKEQTAYFMRRIIEEVPAEVVVAMACADVIVDVGCALGQGVVFLSRLFNTTSVLGIDVSKVAIQKACQMHPRHQLQFRHVHEADWISLGDFDVLVASNVLEHFEEPRQQMLLHMAHCRYIYIILVPWQEDLAGDPYHVYSFTEADFPETLASFDRIVMKPVPMRNEHWGGDQVLVVYQRTNHLTKDAACATMVAQGGAKL